MHTKIPDANCKRCLLVAFHYPPISGSSGVHRTLAFSKYLSSNGWSPIVLTVNHGAFAHIDFNTLGSIPDNVPVYRAWTIDRDRHLPGAGQLVRAFTNTDRWSSWYPSGLLLGARLIRKYRGSITRGCRIIRITALQKNI